jgi:hypothetical protein
MGNGAQQDLVDPERCAHDPAHHDNRSTRSSTFFRHE